MLAFLCRKLLRMKKAHREETTMAWKAPKLVEICVGLEINGYMPPEY
jgi:coenzyme PQQ precursor peptide PqqA